MVNIIGKVFSWSSFDTAIPKKTEMLAAHIPELLNYTLSPFLEKLDKEVIEKHLRTTIALSNRDGWNEKLTLISMTGHAIIYLQPYTPFANYNPYNVVLHLGLYLVANLVNRVVTSTHFDKEIEHKLPSGRLNHLEKKINRINEELEKTRMSMVTRAQLTIAKNFFEKTLEPLQEKYDDANHLLEQINTLGSTLSNRELLESRRNSELLSKR